MELSEHCRKCGDVCEGGFPSDDDEDEDEDDDENVSRCRMGGKHDPEVME